MGNLFSTETLTPSQIQELQDLCQQNPVDLNMKVETIQICGRTVDDNGVRETNLSQDQLVHFNGILNANLRRALREIADEGEKKCHIIIVVDRSGSMSGNPFNQVKLALEEIIGQVIGNTHQTVNVILYDSQATTVQFSAQNYKEAIRNLKAGGTTSFKAAFDETADVIRRHRGENFSETVVIFMTDGKDSVSGHSLVNEYSKKWKRDLQQLCDNLVVHVVGFSRDHDLRFLQRLSKSGATEGLYRYCEPSDGPEALKDKLKELFDFVNWSDGYPVKFDLTLLNKNDMLTMLGSQSGQIDGSLQYSGISEESDLVANADCWITVTEPQNIPAMSAGMEVTLRKGRRNYTFVIPCRIMSQERVIIEDVCGRALWDLSVLSRDTDLLTLKVSKAVTDGNVDGMKLKKTLDNYQSTLSGTKVFSPGFDKLTRASIINYIKDIQTKLDVLHGMLAQHLRGETQDISLLARAHDLRYQAKFSKARRQRLMDRRVAQNFKVVKSDAEKASLISQEELSLLSEEDLKFYFCILSMASVKDLLLDPSDLENAIGLGLAVTRPEHVLDNPTSIQLWSISGALVSRSSLMDAFEYKIRVDGPLATHGGFSFRSSESDHLSHATVGASREPINAWLPLFITPTHWTRVKSCLKQSLGYLCTLDPLGYAHNQLDIFFMVLGHMIGQLTEREAGENQLRLIYAMLRTCRACMTEFNMKEDILQKVGNFLKSPMGRFRHEIPNLYTFIGYIVTLPVSDVTKLLELHFKKTESAGPKFKRLWLGIVSEVIRRAVANTYVASDAKVVSVLNLLLHGSQDVGARYSSSDLVHVFGQLSLQMLTNQRETKLNIPEYDPEEGLTPPEVVVKHSRKVDKAMDILAQHYCNNPEGKKGSAQVTEAKGIVRKWVEEVRCSSGLSIEDKKGIPGEMMLEMMETVIETPPADVVGEESKGAQAKIESKPQEFPTVPQHDHDLLTVLNITDAAKILTELSRHCFPWLSSLPGCIGFLEYWLLNCTYFDDFESNKALPSEEWIQGMKKSIQDIYSKINDFKAECEDKSSEFEGDTFKTREDNDNNPPRGSPQKSVNADVGEYEEEYEDEYEVPSDEEFNSSACIQRGRREGSITLSMILSAIGISENQLQMIRAMLCQAVSYSSNSQAREAVESGRFLDLTEEGQDQRYLSTVEANLVERKEAVKNKMAQRAVWKVGNESMLQAESVWAFIGYLWKTHKERGEGFKELIDLILNCPNPKKYPLLAEKVLVLLSGKYQGYTVFAKGNVWIPEVKLSKLFTKVLGEEAWSNIEAELLSNVELHVYRESDIPNRHGHCNSNPYIPDRIRQLKGLPLLKDLPRNVNKRRCNSKR